MHPNGQSDEQTGSTDSTEWGGIERRKSDRRDAPTPLLRRKPSPARRETGRRHSDHSSYVDRYTRRDVALLMTIFILNVGDAFFTMLWLDRGGREANPVMDFFLDIGPTAFLAQKCLVVGFWLLILMAHKNFRFARIGLYAALLVYGVLILLHFSILAFGIDPPKHDPEDEPALGARPSTSALIEQTRATDARRSWRVAIGNLDWTGITRRETGR